MKFLVALAILVLAVAAKAQAQLVHDPRIIEEVNQKAARGESAWNAGENKMFAGKTLQQVRPMLGAFLLDRETPAPLRRVSAANTVAAPSEFDARKQWPQCIHPIRNQGQCGSCWAFSGSEVLSDRFCIASQQAVNVVLSPQDMVSCDKTDYGCQGGILTNLWTYLENTGITTDGCTPYQSGTGFVPACSTSCKDGSTYKKYKAKQGSTQMFTSIDDAENNIAQYGPVQTGFKVYQDFFSYKSGVYHHVSGGFAGGHAVKIVGWGKDSKSGLDYWIVANSWGTEWGLDGFFWIKKGTDECQIESNMIAGQADSN